jgi:hypothetical protein
LLLVAARAARCAACGTERRALSDCAIGRSGEIPLLAGTNPRATLHHFTAFCTTPPGSK